MALTEGASDRERGETGNAERDGIGNLLELRGGEWKPVGGAVAKLDTGDGGEFLLRVFPLRRHNLCRAVERQIDRPVAETLLRHVSLEVARRGANAHTSELRVGRTEINRLEDAGRPLDHAGIEQVGQCLDER